MQSIADELGVDEFELRKYNRWVTGRWRSDRQSLRDGHTGSQRSNQ